MKVSPLILSFKTSTGSEFDQSLVDLVIRELAIGIFCENTVPDCQIMPHSKKERHFSCKIPSVYENSAVAYLMVKSLYTFSSFIHGALYTSEAFDRWMQVQDFCSFHEEPLDIVEKFSKTPMPNTCLPLISRLLMDDLKVQASLDFNFVSQSAEVEGIALFESEPKLNWILADKDDERDHLQRSKIKKILTRFSDDLITQIGATPELAAALDWISCIHSISCYFLHLKANHYIPRLSKIARKSFNINHSTILPPMPNGGLEDESSFSMIQSFLKLDQSAFLWQGSHEGFTAKLIETTSDLAIGKIKIIADEMFYAAIKIPCDYRPIIDPKKYQSLIPKFDEEELSCISDEEEPIEPSIETYLQSHDVDKVYDWLMSGNAFFAPPHDLQRRQFFLMAAFYNCLPIIRRCIPIWQSQKQELIEFIQSHLRQVYKQLEEAKEARDLGPLGALISAASAAISGPSAATCALFVSSVSASISSLSSIEGLRAHAKSIEEQISYIQNMPLSYCQESYEITPWHIAAELGFTDFLNFLFEIEPQGILAEHGKFNTPIFTALKFSQQEAALFLAEHTRLNRQNEDLQTACMKALELRFFDVADILISRGERLDLMDKESRTGFYYLLRYGHLDQVLNQIDRHTLAINQTFEGNSCLAIAALYHHKKLFDALEKRGALLITEQPKKVLQSIIAMDHLEFVVKEWEKLETTHEMRMRWLMIALEYGSKSCLSFMLEDIRDVSDLTLLLQHSLNVGNQESFILLLKHIENYFPRFFDDFYVDEDESTLAHACIEKGLIEALSLLSGYGVPLHRLNKKGITPFHLAIKHSDIEALKILLDLTPRLLYPDALIAYAKRFKAADCIIVLQNAKIKEVESEDDFVEEPSLDLTVRSDDELQEAILAGLSLDSKIDNIPIFDYVLRENYDKSIKSLLRRYKELEDKERGFYEKAALIAAAGLNHLATVRYLVESQEVNPKVRDRFQNTPLHLAISNGNFSIAVYLASQLADLNFSNRDGKTPLMLSVLHPQKIISHMASPKKSVELVHKKTLFFALVNKSQLEAKDKNQQMAIHFAAASDCEAELAYCIKMQKVVDPIAFIDNRRLTPSYFAALNGAINALTLLFESKANIRFPIDEGGYTPLAFATKHRNLPIIDFILRHIEKLSKQEQKVLFLEAIFHNNAELVKALIDKGISPSAMSSLTGRNALHLTALKDSKSLAYYMIKKGLSIEQADLNGDRPLHIAALTNSLATINLLIYSKSAIDAYNSQKQTPLHLAAKSGHFDAVIRLVSAKAQISIPDENGFTPGQLAFKNGHHYLAIVLFILGDDQLLRERGDVIDWLKYHLFNLLKDQGNALHLAVVLENFTAARLLCYLKPAYCNQVNKQGITPLELSKRVEKRNEKENLLIQALLGHHTSSHLPIVPMMPLRKKHDRHVEPLSSLSSIEIPLEPFSEDSALSCSLKDDLILTVKEPAFESIDAIRRRFLTETDTVCHPIDPALLDLLLECYQEILASSSDLKTQPVSLLKEKILEQKKLLKIDPDHREALLLLISLLREMLARCRGYYPHSTQMLVLLSFIFKDERTKGAIVQVKTGEGKSLIIALLAAVLALQGQYVDIVTSNLDLAARDHLTNRLFFSSVGITSSHIEAKKEEDKAPYRAVIVYGTAHEFEAAYLKDHLYNQEIRFVDGYARPMDNIIVDEVDNLFYEGALYSTRITSSSLFDYSWILKAIWETLEKFPTITKEELYHELLRLERVSSRPDKLIKTLPLFQLETWLNSAKKARNELHENEDYVLEDIPLERREKKVGAPLSVLIIDKENTGRAHHHSRFESGIHEFLELKHGIEPEDLSLVASSKAHVPFFKDYRQILGITGTIGEACEREELRSIYAIDRIFDVPTHYPSLHIEHPMQYLLDEVQWQEAILKQASEMIASGRPVLILFSDIKKTLQAQMIFEKARIKAKVITDVQKENEDYLIKRAGFSGQVTLATNAAGRGADIILHPEAIAKGGLHCIVAFYGINKRVEDQAIGRAARQGKPGSSCVITYADDPMIQLFFPHNPEIRANPDHILKVLDPLRKWYTEQMSTKRVQQIPKELKSDALCKEFYPHLQTLRLQAELCDAKFMQEVLESLKRKKIKPAKKVIGNHPTFLGETLLVHQIFDRFRSHDFVDFDSLAKIIKTSFMSTILKKWGIFFQSIQQEKLEDKDQSSCELFEKFSLATLRPAIANTSSSITNYVELLLSHGSAIHLANSEAILRSKLRSKFFSTPHKPTSDSVMEEPKRKWLLNFAYALAGDPDAQTQLGDAYLNGHHVKKNRKIAIQYYQAAAIKGHQAARARYHAFSIPGAFKKPFIRATHILDPFDLPHHTVEFACWLKRQETVPHSEILSQLLIKRAITDLQLEFNKHIQESHKSLSFGLKDLNKLRIKIEDLDTTQPIYREFVDLYIKAYECLRNQKSTPKEKWDSLFDDILVQFKRVHPLPEFGLKEDLGEVFDPIDFFSDDPTLTMSQIQSKIEEIAGDNTPKKRLEKFVIQILSSSICHHFKMLACQEIQTDASPIEKAFINGLIAFFRLEEDDLNVLKLLIHFEKLYNLQLMQAKLMRNHLLRCIKKSAKKYPHIGHAYALLIELGYYKEENHQEKAFKAYEAAMGLGSDKALDEVIERYFKGLGVDKNPEMVRDLTVKKLTRPRREYNLLPTKQLLALYEDMFNAVSENNVMKVNELFSYGASKDFISLEGLTLLGAAMRHKAYAVFKLLYSRYKIQDLTLTTSLKTYITAASEEDELRSVCRELGIEC
jgi:preprotein translocase subunit SecA/ankyrin repeat protein/TPR repeat protein